MPVQPLPRPAADAIADFVECRARTSRPAHDLTEADDRAGWDLFVQRYRQAVRDQHELTADNLAHALLDIAVLFEDQHDFKPAWLHWQEVLKGLEDERV